MWHDFKILFTPTILRLVSPLVCSRGRAEQWHFFRSHDRMCLSFEFTARKHALARLFMRTIYAQQNDFGNEKIMKYFVLVLV